MFSGSSRCLLGQHVSCSTAQRPVELSENMLQKLFHNLMPQTVLLLDSEKCLALPCLITVQVPVLPSGLLARGVAPHRAAAAGVAEDRGRPLVQRLFRRRRRSRPLARAVRGLLRLLPHPRIVPRDAGLRRLLHSLRPSEDIQPEQVGIAVNSNLGFAGFIALRHWKRMSY